MDIPTNHPLPWYVYGPLLAVALYFSVKIGDMLFKIALNLITSKPKLPDVTDCPFPCSRIKESDAKVQRLGDTYLDKYKHQEDHQAEREERKKDTTDERKERKGELSEFLKEMGKWKEDFNREVNNWKGDIIERLHSMEVAFTAAGIDLKKK